HGHLDDINGIDHFYIEPHQVGGMEPHVVGAGRPGERQGGHNKQGNNCSTPDPKNHSSKLELNELRKQQEECVQSEKDPPQIKNECNGNGNINESAIPFMRPASIQGKEGVVTEALGSGRIGEREAGAAEEKDNHYMDGSSCGSSTRGGKSSNWYVLLDAASYVATNALDLSLHPADFIVLSFYKMFGFPTGESNNATLVSLFLTCSSICIVYSYCIV
ncbi:unnamed protein product, partial [Allacma fusca]